MFIFSCSFDDPCNEIKFSIEFLKAIQQDKNIYSHRSNCKPFIRFFSATFFPSAHRPIGQKCLLPPPLLRDQPYECTESGTVFTASKSELGYFLIVLTRFVINRLIRGCFVICFPRNNVVSTCVCRFACTTLNFMDQLQRRRDMTS